LSGAGGSVSEAAARVRRLVRVEGGRPRFLDGGEEALDELRRLLVREYAAGRLGEARRWIEAFLGEAYRAVSLLGARGVLLPKELRSFIRDPEAHLMKKLFQYSLYYAAGSLSLEELLSKARSAVTTSVNTNMRSLYQYWVFAALLSLLASRGARLVYPEHGYIYIERTGRQRGGGIPANAALSMPGRGYASFYLEAPRPVGWGDNRDLERAWRLYVSLRPDMIVYSGLVLDMVEDSGEGPTVRRPQLIVEFKEQSDWYERTRYLKGLAAKPMTASEWFQRWYQGLKAGLADVLGVEGVEPPGERARPVRVKEYRLILLYRSVYRPDRLVLVSRARMPGEIVAELESEGVTVLHGVEMGDRASVEPLADIVEEFFSGGGVDPVDAAVRVLEESLGAPVDRVLAARALAELAVGEAERLSEIYERLRRGQADEEEAPQARRGRGPGSRGARRARGAPRRG